MAAVDSSLGFYPIGAIRKITLGSNLTQTAAFDNRLQPCRFNLNSSGSALGSCTDFPPSGSMQDYNYGFGLGTSDNGNVASMTATGTQTFNRTYTYDQLNRLAVMSSPAGPTGDTFCAGENQHCTFSGTIQVAYGANGTFVYKTLTNGTDCNNTVFGDPLVGTVKACYIPGSSSGCLGLSWTYDPWGNRTSQNVTAGTCFTSAVTVNMQNQVVDPINHIYQYDAAGNLTADGSHTYTYDAENRLIKVDGGNTATYVYDPLGRRVEKVVGTTRTDYVYDLSGNAVAEVNNVCASICWAAFYASLNGQLVAEYKNLTTYFFHGDHLGSTRLVTGMTQAVVQNLDYLPFGELNSTDSGISTHEFTGDERDAETSLDHTQFRQYTSQLARWITPDPAGLAAVDPGNPQSWNRYAYVDDDPMDFIDPLGLFQFVPSNCISVNPTQVGGSPQPSQIFCFGAGGGLGGHYVPSLDAPPVGFPDFGGGLTMGPTPAPPPPTIGPDPDWFHSKQAMCLAQAAKAVGKDLIFSDVFNAVADSIAAGSLSPLGDLFSAGTAVTAVEQTADYVAGHQAVQTVARGFFRTQGVRVSASAIGRDARLLGKWAGAVGLVLSTKTGYDAYNACMSN